MNHDIAFSTEADADHKTSGQRILTTGRIAEGIFHWQISNLTLDCFCRQPIGTLVNSKLDNIDIAYQGH